MLCLLFYCQTALLDVFVWWKGKEKNMAISCANVTSQHSPTDRSSSIILWVILGHFAPDCRISILFLIHVRWAWHLRPKCYVSRSNRANGFTEIDMFGYFGVPDVHTVVLSVLESGYTCTGRRHDGFIKNSINHEDGGVCFTYVTWWRNHPWR